MDEPECPIIRLPTELLGNILEILAPYSEKLISFDYRHSLSVESFASVPPTPVDPNAIAIWRRVCRRFAEIGVHRQFARVAVRFSKKDFERLDEIRKQPKLSSLVRKFSYVVSGFTSLRKADFQSLLDEERSKRANILRDIQSKIRAVGSDDNEQLPSIDSLHARYGRSKDNEKAIEMMMLRAQDQREILQAGIDQSGLLSALSSFSELEQIRLMPVHDAIDVNWSRFVHSRQNMPAESKSARWKRACKHGAETLGWAFLQSSSSATRISCRALDPQAWTSLVHCPPREFLNVAERLVCLELQFDDRAGLKEEILEFADLFQRGFSTAVNIKGLHIGFTRPVYIPFEAIFRHSHFKALQYIGFGGWCLRSPDVIEFLRRHRATLRGVRLRGVLLEEPGRWVEILKFLRLELQLKWVSLRSVGYAAQGNLGGLHATDQGDGDSDVSEEEWHISESDESSTGPDEGLHQDSDRDSRSSATSQTGDSDDEHGVDEGEDSEHEINVNDLAIDDRTMLQHISIVSEDTSQCSCGEGFAWNDLQDDWGVRPSKETWKRWELWVTKHCPLGHDAVAASSEAQC